MEQEYVLRRTQLGTLRSLWKNRHTLGFWIKEDPQYVLKAGILPKPGDFDKYLVLSSRFLGEDQYLYQRLDTWPCFWKAVELVATGHNDPNHKLTLFNFNESFKDAQPSAFPEKSIMHYENFCYGDAETGAPVDGIHEGDPNYVKANFGPIGFWGTGFQAEQWLFQRTFPVWKEKATTWERCRQYYDEHSWNYSPAIPFLLRTPSFATYQDDVDINQYLLKLSPTGYQEYNNWQLLQGGKNITTGTIPNLPILTPPYTDNSGSYHASSGQIVTDPGPLPKVGPGSANEPLDLYGRATALENQGEQALKFQDTSET